MDVQVDERSTHGSAIVQLPPADMSTPFSTTKTAPTGGRRPKCTHLTGTRRGQLRGCVETSARRAGPFAFPSGSPAVRRLVEARGRVADLPSKSLDQLGRVVTAIGKHLARLLAERRRERVHLPHGGRGLVAHAVSQTDPPASGVPVWCRPIHRQTALHTGPVVRSNCEGVKLDLMMLANYAEVAPTGLLYVAGGSWDTTTVNAPLPDGAPEDAVALLNGYLAVRILFHVTETDREHRFTLTIMDEDGGETARLEGEIRVDRSPGLPPAWDHGVNMAIGLTGIAVFQFGLYTISLQVDGQHLGDRPFRVVRGYDDA